MVGTLTTRRTRLTQSKALRVNQPAAEATVLPDRWIPQIRIFYSGRTKAGVRITPDNAVTISAVWACIRFISQSIGALPWHVIDDETKMPVSMSVPAESVLVRPSPEYSSLQFRETLLHWALRWGNGYAEIERDILGRPKALHPIHPERVCVMRDPVTYELYYSVGQGSGVAPVVLDAMDMFHLRGMGEGPVGLNVIAYAAESLGWVKAVQMFGAGFFGEGAMPAGVVMMKKPLTEDGMKALEKKFRNMYSGSKNAGKTAILDSDMDYKPLTVEPDKGQFIETNQFLIDEVCRWFGVPPHKIYKLLNATFSNIEHQSIEVVTDSLKPWARRLEDEAAYKLLGQNRAGYTNKINLKGLLTGDTKTRLEWYRGLREIGVLNADEILELEDMPLIGKANGGQKRVMQSQYTTLDKIGEEPLPVDGPAPAEPAAPPEEEPGEEVDEATPEQMNNFHNAVLNLTAFTAVHEVVQ
jgi:HK97 family phage portal protein